MKTVFIGNSHLGPVAFANAKLDLETPGYESRSFISRTYGKVPLKIFNRDNALVVNSIMLEDTASVAQTLDLDEVDRIIIVGLRFSLITLVESWIKYQPDALNATFGEQLITSELTEEYNNFIMDETPAAKLIERLVEVTDKPIFLIPAPLPAEWVATRDGTRFEAFHAFLKSDSRQYLLEAYTRQLNRMEARGVGVVVQPAETVSDKVWTKNSFCLSSDEGSSPDSFYARGDFYHMNKSFGVSIINSMIDSNILISDLN